MSQQPIVNLKKDRTEAAKALKLRRDKDREMVKGMFKFYEVPGGNMRFNYKAYREDPVEHFDMDDGQIYTIPRGVARHLNNNGWYPIHQHYTSENGTQVRVGQKVHRYGFQNLEFMDLDDDVTDASKRLITVEKL